MTDPLADLERAIADPNNKTQTVEYIRALRSMVARVSLGRVSACVDGYGALKRVEIATDTYSDPARLGRLVRRAVNAAIQESDRRIPPLPSPFDNPFGPTILPPPRPPTSAYYGGALTAKDRAEWRGLVRGETEAQRAAWVDAALIVRDRVKCDFYRVESDLADMLGVVYWRLGKPRLHAAWVRWAAEVTNPSSLDWFRVELGVSLTEYIRRRRLETAARLIFRSDLTLGEIATMCDYDGVFALRKAVKDWCGLTPAGLRFYWERLGLDYVLLKWAAAGKATIGQEQQVRDDLWRWEKRLDELQTVFGSEE